MIQQLVVTCQVPIVGTEYSIRLIEEDLINRLFVKMGRVLGKPTQDGAVFRVSRKGEVLPPRAWEGRRRSSWKAEGSCLQLWQSCGSKRGTEPNHRTCLRGSQGLSAFPSLFLSELHMVPLIGQSTQRPETGEPFCPYRTASQSTQQGGKCMWKVSGISLLAWRWEKMWRTG